MWRRRRRLRRWRRRRKKRRMTCEDFEQEEERRRKDEELEEMEEEEVEEEEEEEKEKEEEEEVEEEMMKRRRRRRRSRRWRRRRMTCEDFEQEEEEEEEEVAKHRRGVGRGVVEKEVDEEEVEEEKEKENEEEMVEAMEEEEHPVGAITNIVPFPLSSSTLAIRYLGGGGGATLQTKDSVVNEVCFNYGEYWLWGKVLLRILHLPDRGGGLHGAPPERACHSERWRLIGSPPPFTSCPRLILTPAAGGVVVVVVVVPLISCRSFISVHLTWARVEEVLQSTSRSTAVSSVCTLCLRFCGVHGGGPAWLVEGGDSAERGSLEIPGTRDEAGQDVVVPVDWVGLRSPDLMMDDIAAPGAHQHPPPPPAPMQEDAAAAAKLGMLSGELRSGFLPSRCPQNVSPCGD
ncbi:unnamed protein product [Gadus morhua 'NCC']